MKKLISNNWQWIIIFFLPFVFQSCYISRALYYQTAGIYDYKIFPYRTIAASESPIALKQSVHYNQKNLSSEYFQEFMKYKTTAFLVLKDDSLIFEQYWNNGGPNVISNSFSMAKSITGLLIGFAIQDGKIKSVDQYACEYLPEFNSACKKHIRIKDLLTMSSGLTWDESYFNPFSKTTRAYYGRNLYKQMMNLRVMQTPGYTFRYLSCNTQILGLLLSEALNKNISEYTYEKLWNPIGAEHAALWSIDRKNGYEKAYCCFYATARDFAKIGLFVLHEGKVNGKQILNEKYIKESTSPAKNLTDNEGNSVDFYGYQWWLLNYKNMNITLAWGLYGQFIIIIPEKQMVIVRLGHKSTRQTIGHYTADLYRYIDAAFDLVP
ncbi:MAG: beta-lactamase family protein [Bacteroidales bacterium]|nr:beta-lactamase family protein [Bacteroidales bacterium]